MRLFKRILSLVSVALLVAIVTTVSAFINYGQNNLNQTVQRDDQSKLSQLRDQFPTVSYQSEELADPEKRAKRKVKNARHDNSHFVYKDIPVGSAIKSTSFNDWEAELPALPVPQSNIIAVGEVLSSEAYLSNDKSGIYSEFNTIITNIFKNSSSLPVVSGSSVTLERAGGALLYPNGHKHLYVIAGQNMPRIRRRYVFFLNCTGETQNCRIITAYELKEGRVNPLDDVDTFEVYKGIDETKFLNILRTSTTSHN